jgi:hypothetical protein
LDIKICKHAQVLSARLNRTLGIVSVTVTAGSTRTNRPESPASSITIFPAKRIYFR